MGVGSMGIKATPVRNVAIFLDLENLYGGHHNGVEGVPLGKVVREIERIVRDGGLGRRTATIRAYANWGHLGMHSYQREVLEYGIKPIQIFSFDKNVKNAADIELCVDVLQVVHESPWIDVFVIVTGDGGFVPLIRRLHGLNKYVVVASTNSPTAGVVNSLLKSVADEYHLINVLAPAALLDGVEPVALQPAVSEVRVKVTPAKPDAVKAVPATKDLRSTILTLAKLNPAVTIDGQVNASALGQLLRKNWPNIKYANYDSKTLSGFVEKHCGLVVQRPVLRKAKKVIATAVPEPHQEVINVANRDEYIVAIRSLFRDGDLGRAVTSKKSVGMSLTEAGQYIKNTIVGFAKEDPDFPRLQFALHQALAASEYMLAVQEGETMYLLVNIKYLKPGMVPVPIWVGPSLFPEAQA